MSNETLPEPLPDVDVNNLTAVNITVSGTLTANTFISISQIETDDTLIKLAANNTADIVDLGWYAKYVNAGTKYRGNVFDVSTNRFIFFTTNTEPTTTVSGQTFLDVQMKDLYAANVTGTLQTAAQPNITSVGTLTGLTMAGNLDMAGFNLLNLGSFVIDELDATITRAAQPNITSVGTLLGLTLAGDLDMGGFDLVNLGSFSVSELDATITRAAQPNITSLGTLTGLSINGTLNMLNNNIINIATFSATSLGGTLTTAAQPNITSVGTLTSLTLAGNLNMSTNNINNVATLTATNLGGTLTTAAQPNITSTGTLTSLTMAGNINMGTNNITNATSVTATNLTGTLQTAAQPNITSTGTLTSLTMGGNINMGTNSITNATSITATNLTGTLQTAAQPNITSTGTLTSLTVSGVAGFASGTALLPSIAFALDLDTGIYRIGVDQLGITTNGTLNFSFSPTQNETKNAIWYPNGLVSAPAIAFAASSTTGIYSSGANTIDFATNSNQRLSLSTTSLTLTNDDAAGDQFQIIGRTAGTKKIVLGYNTTSDFGKIEVTAATPLRIQASSLSPNADSSIGLGTSSLKWNNSYINRVYATAGAVGTPTFTFESDTNTGFYSVGADQIGAAVGGVLAWTFGSTNISANQIQAPVGSTSSASYAFASDPNTGMFSSAADTINFTAGGTNALQITASAISTSLPFTFNGDLFANAYYFTGDPDTSITNPLDDNNIIFTTGGTTRLTISTSTVTSTIRYQAPNGNSSQPGYEFSSLAGTGFYFNGTRVIGVHNGNYSMSFNTNEVVLGTNVQLLADIGNTAANPSYSFDGYETMGMYAIASTTLGFATSANLRLSISTTLITSTLPFLGPAGSVTNATYSFSGDPNTGMYSSGADTLNFTTGGTARLTLDTATATSTLKHSITNAEQSTNTLYLNSSHVTYNSTAMYVNFARAATASMNVWHAVANSVSLALLSGLGYWYVSDGTAAAPSYSFLNDTDTGLYLSGTNAIGITTGGTVRAVFDSSQALFLSGSAATPSISFLTETNSGLYLSSSNVVGLAVAGAVSATFSTTQALFLAGTNSLPGVSFITDPNTGIYQTGVADTLGFSTGGTNRLTLNTATFDSSLPVRITGNSKYLTINTTEYQMRVTNGGAQFDQAFMIRGPAAGSLGYISGDFSSSDTDTGLTFNISNTGGQIIRTGIIVANAGITRTAGSETGNVIFYVKPSGSGVVEAARVFAGSSTEVQFGFANGTAALPSICFTNDNDTGMYYTGTANTLALTTGGTARLTLNTTELTSAVRVFLPSGTAGSPSLTFTSDTGQNTGMFLSAENVIGFSTNGTSRLTIDSNGINVNTHVLVGASAANLPAYSFTADTNTGMFSSGADVLGFSAGGTERFSISTSSVTSTLRLILPSGAAGTPSLTFAGDTDSNSGMFLSAENVLEWSTNGTSRMALNTTELTLSARLFLPNGSAGAPSLTFTNDSNSGLYYTGTADTIALTTGGTARLTLNTATCDSALPVRVTGTTSYLLVNTTDRTYRSTNGGATTDQPLQVASSTVSAGFGYFGIDHAGGSTDMGVNFNALNTNNQIIRTATIVTNGSGGVGASSRTAGAEIGNMLFLVKPSGAAVTEAARVFAGSSTAVQFGFGAGTVALPSICFTSDNDTGLYNSAANNIDVTTAGTRRLNIDSSGNMALGASPSFGSGQVVLFIANATAVPSANPTGGGILYVEGGALKYRGSSGTITTIAPA